MKAPLTGVGEDGPPKRSEYSAIKHLPATSTPAGPLSFFQRIPKRYVMCVLILLSNILCYADRTNISIAVLPGNIPLASDTDRGQVLASFFYGYICTQLLGGILSIRYGGKPVLLVGVLIWIICDGLTVPASTYFPLLLVARIGMGLGEGVNFPADHAMVAAWFVEQERSAFLAVISAGVDIGTIVSSGLSPLIAAQLGWKWIYGIYCFIGLAWLALFALLGASKPEWHPTIGEEERSFILRNRSSARPTAAAADAAEHDDYSHAADGPPRSFLASLLNPPGHDIPWRRYLTSRSLYGIIAAHTMFNYGFYVMLSWLPSYYVHLGTDLKSGGFLSISLPYIAGAIGGPLAGWICNRLIERGWRIRSVRILMNTVGSVGASLSMFIIAFAPPASTAMGTLVLSVGYFFFRFSFSGYWANMVDIGGANAGHIMGISNTIATIPGMVGNTLTGAILQATGSWSMVFFLAATAYALAGVIYFWTADDVDLTELDEKEKRREAALLVGDKALADDDYDEVAAYSEKHALNSALSSASDDDV